MCLFYADRYHYTIIMIWNRILRWFRSSRQNENELHDIKIKQSITTEHTIQSKDYYDVITKELKDSRDRREAITKELKDSQDRREAIMKEIKDEVDNDTTEDRLLVPWRKLYTRHLFSMQVHHYDWVDELDNWIRGDTWVQEYRGYDNYYNIYTLNHSEKELEIEQFDDNFYEWQIDELAKPGSP
jgi:hypothetical protein